MGEPRNFVVLFLMTSLVAIFVCGDNRQSSTQELENLFKEIGFSSSWVSQTLALYEDSVRNTFLTGITVQANIIQNTMDKLKEVQNRPRNCADLLHTGDTESGIRTVYPFTCCHNRPVSVFCDQTTDGGGWTVIQHRDALPQRENFFRNWVEYELGFGKLEGEFWLGLNNIHALVSDALMEMRVDMEDYNGVKRWAKYYYFYIGNAQDKYRLDLGPYSGNAGDSLTSYHNRRPFSTKDNDSSPKGCTSTYQGAWWYGDKNCHLSNLNGFQHQGNHTSFANGINWHSFRGYHHSLRTTSLSVRPQN